jgi:hypothetical protein
LHGALVWLLFGAWLSFCTCLGTSRPWRLRLLLLLLLWLLLILLLGL